ncbi:uncharacterized protein FIBRA_09210 [Fibroporia radiculosa]|uniref:Endonuclease/exonuclease/phosphatase domain-containing protein n=1 Tax=Fibroporia radiculosa TaxID=599839 RepID=J7RVJ6_9APHY|nr:uncharacterized protein FIBRA_09210 [Fibroporia radiculosa]CCM06900.1 predicted protein [Fibroporia radiculosa]
MSLPPIAVMAGDFNLRHVLWDKGSRRAGTRSRHGDKALALITLAQEEMGLDLLNDDDGIPTWIPNSTAASPGTIDLVWLDPDYREGEALLKVDQSGRHRSDHAVLKWNLAIDVNPTRDPRIPRTGTAAQKYLNAVAVELHAYQPVLQSKEDVVEAAAHLQQILSTHWASHATPPKISARSRTWWNRRCQRAAQRVRDATTTVDNARVQYRTLRSSHGSFDASTAAQGVVIRAAVSDLHNRRGDLKKATRAAKRGFFDACIKRANPKLILDFVQWTKPRKQSANVQLKMRDGRPANTTALMAEAFQTQFTPANPKPVDWEMIEAIPQLPEREFPPFSEPSQLAVD